LWNKTSDADGDDIYSFGIITTPANSLIRKLGSDRMPVIIPEYKERRWLSSTNSMWQILDILNPYPAKLMNAYPISEKIAHKTLNDISLVQPVGKRILYEPNYLLSRKKKKEVRESTGNTMAERAGLNDKTE